MRATYSDRSTPEGVVWRPRGAPDGDSDGDPRDFMSNEAALPKNFLRRCLLLLLGERADYGYDLVERLGPFGFDGSDPGGVYRALRMMERDELVCSAWRPSGTGPYRRVYELTPAGRRELAQGAWEITHSHDRLDAFIDRYARLACEPVGTEMGAAPAPLPRLRELGAVGHGGPPPPA